MGSGSSKPLPQHLAPKPAFRAYAGYKVQFVPKSACVALGDPSLADRHPDKLALLMLYDTRYAWNDINLQDYRNKLRNVFKGDAQVLKWLHSDACKYRLERARNFVGRTKNPLIALMPFRGDPMYGVYVDSNQVCRNLTNMWNERGIGLRYKHMSYHMPTNPDASVRSLGPRTGRNRVQKGQVSHWSR